MFHAFGTKLLTSTAYHPQTDGLLEKTNQTIEIALCFLISSGVSWPKILPAFQSAIMNTSSTVTGASSNQILYRFNTRDRIGLLNLTIVKTQPEIDRLSFQRKVTNAIAFVNAKIKSYYDLSYKPPRLNIGDMAFF